MAHHSNNGSTRQVAVAVDGERPAPRRRVNRGLRPRTKDAYPAALQFSDEEHDEAEDETPATIAIEQGDRLDDLAAESATFDALIEDEDEDDEDPWPGPQGEDTIDAADDEHERRSFLDELPGEEVERKVVTTRWMWRLVKHRQDADILGRLVLWTAPHHRKRPQPSRGLPKPWTAKTSKRLAEETGWSEGEVRASLRRLREDKLIGWKICKFGKVTQRHIWINWGAIRALWNKLDSAKRSS